MKKVTFTVALVAMSVCLTSCGTLFTPSSQEITFTGESGISIYDNAKKIAEIGKEGSATAKIRKKLSSKTLVAKKDGYKNVPFKLAAEFNPISIINLLDPLAWAVDLASGKCCKWEDDVIEIEMGKKAE